MSNRWSSAARRVYGCVMLLVIAGCQADRSMVARTPYAIAVLSGDRQAGAPTQPLAQPIAARVVDATGEPIVGAMVQWSASAGGSVAPSVRATDANGVARAVWTLGATTGVQHAYAASNGLLAAEFTATAGDSGPPGDAIVLLTLETPDGSGQTVHPDYVAMPSSWHGAPQYLAITPYPNGNATFENPSIFAGSDPIVWHPPAGLRNPIVSPTDGYLSDPDEVYVPDYNELWVYYREVNTHNVIRLKRSSDGVHFGPSTTVTEGANHTIVSPTVVRRSATDWLMWSVNANVGCGASTTSVELRRSSDGLVWSGPQTVSLVQPGYSAWHIDVQWIPSRGEYWALYNAKTPGSCATPALYLATSADGVTWQTFPSPVLARGAIPEFADIVYRSTFAYDPDRDVISFWYSGARYESPNYVWRSAFQRRSRGEVFASIASAADHALALGTPRPNVPPLLDGP